MTAREVNPRFKEPPRVKKPRPRLRRTGKRMMEDIAAMRAARVLLLERSRGRCEAQFSELCTGYGVHAHHIKRRSAGGSNDPSNLLFCCAICHAAIHDHPAEALVAGYLMPGWA